MAPTAIVAAGARKGALTRELIIQKILRWNALYGEPPRTADWNPSLARWRAQEWRIERYRLGDPETGERWPSVNAAKRHFDGSFDAAVRAAGLVPHRPGPRRRAAGSAVPAIEQRAPQAPREVEAELVSAAGRVLEAERRAAAADARVAEVERAASERAAASNGAAAASGTGGERETAVLEARLRAAEARARAAEAARVAGEARAARMAEARVEAAERRVRELGAAAAAVPARIDAAHAAELRNGRGPVGPGPLADALKALAKARATHDRVALNEALTLVASAAVRWRERL